MKITKSQLKQIIKEELDEVYGRHDPGTRIGPNDEIEGLSPYRDRPDPSRYGSGANPEEIEAWETRQAERDPDREYIEMVKSIMSFSPNSRVMATDKRNKKLIKQAEEEFFGKPGRGLGGPGGKARHPTPEEIAAAHANKDKQ